MYVTVPEQREIQERGSPSRGQFQLQQIVDCNVPESGTGGHCVPAQDQRWRKVDNGGADHVLRDV